MGIIKLDWLGLIHMDPIGSLKLIIPPPQKWVVPLWPNPIIKLILFKSKKNIYFLFYERFNYLLL